ncbi:EamA family transporter [Paucibacter sp. PLA-PC-4]|uniref:DMT family transporter n=1 Tax=Paucibacter sp. PLA-PC-4 TaxID=2993655 RepID=UPI00224A9408|nr:EamA family transporter [Paucibacter sp. PLA-PC-4]MCX2863498.1 EamA family transporter [Paucibacter sp. PLA-PC-4]
MTASTLAPVSTASREQRQGQALMLAGGLLLGTLGVFLEEAGQDPLTAVWFRCAFGGLALLAWGLISARLGELWLARRGLLAAVAAGLLMLLNWGLFFAAIERTSIAVATVVFHVQPLLVMAFGVLFLREPFSRRQGVAALLALLGLALAAGLTNQLQALDRAYVWGLLMCLGGSLSYAAVTLIAKSVRGVSSFALAWWQCAVGSLALLAWPLSQGWPAWGAAWGWLAGLGLIHTGLAYVLLYAGINRLPAGRIAVLQFVYPAAAVLVDWAVYGRSLSPLQLLGVAMMAAAIASLKR